MPLEEEAARYPTDQQVEQGRGGWGGRSEARQVAAAQALVLAQAREDRESGQEGGAARAAMEGQVYERMYMEGGKEGGREMKERMCVRENVCNIDRIAPVRVHMCT